MAMTGERLSVTSIDLVMVAVLDHKRLETTAICTQPSARNLERAVERRSVER